MHPTTPRLEIHPERMAHNLRVVTGQCAEHGVSVAAVTKVMGAHPAVLSAIAGSAAAMVADSRISNLQRIASAGLGLPTMLLRPVGPGSAADVVRWADYSLNSSVTTIRALSEAAVAGETTHRIVLMVDVGDLREGIWPDRVAGVIKQVARLPHIEVAGLGTNLACYGGVAPTPENLAVLVEVRNQCRTATGLPLDLLSGGNSSNLPLMAAGQMPPQINQLRIGEAIWLGRNVLDRTPWPGARQDTVRVVAEVVELERKPSVPLGPIGQDAFGGHPVCVDRGVRRRAICNIGRQDIAADALTPQDPGIIVLGASSDHLILDVEDAVGPVQVGCELGFWPSYGGLLSASTSPYVWKVAVADHGATAPATRQWHRATA
ncbi:MAG: alanine/ornithine racemase family PLP-dependent enzyme [Propioniciclava sp.]|uniref:alanine/ornithine racemase family PLP-dependent enzyme n=1 Tax=Propioniciclava sp. TaxID=2038686 RepID=UPI0039E6BDD2